jgi:hypothetical protein
MTKGTTHTPTYSFVAAIFLMVAAIPASAQSMPVPVELQANIFKKVFEYSKGLENIAEITVLVASEKPSADPAPQVVKAFAAAGMTAKGVAISNLSESVSGKTVVYVLSGAAIAKGVCEKAGLLSITGVPSMVESGDVAVGLGSEGGKPKIIVHKGRVDAQKQELSSKLLQLAKIVG